MNERLTERLANEASPPEAAPFAPHIAVVGSGPSGCYTAQMLKKKWNDAQITVFDRLPVPFGLLRYGVSPDHQSTKSISRQFSRMFESGSVAFVGNVQVGKDISVGRLREAFDIVVLATGLGADRALPGIAGGEVYGAGRVMRWFNAHPDELLFEPKFGRTTAIIGSGNVAIDVVRLLSKHSVAFTGSDLDPSRLDKRPNEIVVVGRSDGGSARFDSAMIRELGKLDDVAFHVELPDHPREQNPLAVAKLEALRELCDEGRHVHNPRVRVKFRFGWIPLEAGNDSEGMFLRIADSETGNKTDLLRVDSVVTAVGFRGGLEHEIDRAIYESDRSNLAAGVLDDGLYCVGWFRRGPIGGIPDNRADAKLVTEQIVSDSERSSLVADKPGFESLAHNLHSSIVDFDGWVRIDRFESETTTRDRCRTKVPDVATMLDIALRKSR
ncbi:FAD-dependent oxidoreductase [Rhodococcus sp. Eu-32]|uniref:FAD-dependent oxidoreductase n=1 Tax=Rhodococcus sp. Eu-32 TaxID=1017319 RepID=UPI0014021313|nr:FAD-dependent oxidoreductase [Rhodococcus sp. Eu-32]